jgi:hypothetical protein
VTSLKKLSDDERFLARASEEVMRSPRPGTPRERMLKLTLYSERDAAKILRLERRDTGQGAAATVGMGLIL